MASGKARPAREAPSSGPEGEDKAKKKHLVQKSGKYNMILHRDTLYRENARGVLKATEIYDDETQIEKGMRNQRTVKRAAAAKRAALIAEKIPKYKFDYVNRDTSGKPKNFEYMGRPYGNQAHHILVCELFYDKRWTADHLDVVKQTKYNINNPHNIIYLPLTDRDVTVHALPNHRNGHNTYSEKQLDEHVTKIFNMVDQALDEAKDKKCEPEALKDIYDKLIAVEDQYWKLLISRPGASMA